MNTSTGAAGLASANAEALGRRTRVRWFVVFMAFFATAVNYIDRANLGVAAPFIQKEFNLSPAAMGSILGAFFWTYAAFQIPAGMFVDKVGARAAYAVAVVWWSFFTAALAFARGFGSLFGFRLLLGAGEAPAYPCNAKVVSDWFPRSERAFATGIFDAGARIGTALSLPIVTALIGSFGWRTSFVVTGAIGFVWTGVWLVVYKLPRLHPWVSPAELAHIEAGQTAAPVAAATAGDVPVDAEAPLRWRDLFKYRAIWGMMLGFFCLNFVIYFFITWFPTYLVKARGFTMLKLGFFGMIPALCAAFSGALGGYVSDRLLKSGMPLSRARKIPIVAGMAVASCIALTVFVPSATWALVILSISYSALTFAGASVWALPGDVAPTRKYVASIGGIQNFAANLAGISISTFVGVMLGKTGGFVVPLVVAGGFALLGAVTYLFIVPEIGPLPINRPRPTARR